jgi:hypothetical protein
MDPALSAKEAQIQAMARYADKLSVSLDGANLEISNMKVSLLEISIDVKSTDSDFFSLYALIESLK